jgi:hypothetical protein
MNINITLVNQTSQPWVFMMYTKAPDLGLIGQTILSNAWAVMSLGVDQQQSTTFKTELDISVREPNFNNRLTQQAVENNDIWNFATEGSSTSAEFYGALALQSNRNKDGTITVNNTANEKVDIQLLSDGRPLLTYQNVGKGSRADFQLHPTIYVVFGKRFVQNEIISADIMASVATKFDLTNVSNITLVATENPASGEITITPQVIYA